MTPLRGFYAYNALLGYQNDTATRFLYLQRPFGLPKWHRYAVFMPTTPFWATKMTPLRGFY